ncbi:MAG: EF-hand domain-containing protein [Magnetococcales bacterium]|nr:EF-hand domain-containing protein [Magnetococcales bacterium]
MMNISMNSAMMGTNSMQRMGGRPPMGSPPSADKMIAKLDKNGDGTLGSDEVKGKLADDFGTVDSDSDGQLTADELDAALESIRAKMGNMPGPMGAKGGQGGPQGAGGPGGAGGPPSAADLLSMMDDDEDGAIGSDEVKGPLADKFDAVDTDDDGVISQEELEVDLEAMQKEHASQMESLVASVQENTSSVPTTSGQSTNPYERLQSLLQNLGLSGNTSSLLTTNLFA